MFRSVLVVCVGNICRSPLGERLLQKECPTLDVSSAGIGALIGHPADDDTAKIAQAHGVSLEGHIARQFTSELGSSCDLILAMEPGHVREIIKIAPHLSGRVMLFDHWAGAKGIRDPYRQSIAFHEITYQKISIAAQTWQQRLQPATS